jgi:hypothetical protein
MRVLGSVSRFLPNLSWRSAPAVGALSEVRGPSGETLKGAATCTVLHRASQPTSVCCKRAGSSLRPRCSS